MALKAVGAERKKKKKNPHQGVSLAGTRFPC